MGFLHPEFLLLAIPAAWIWWRTRTDDRTGLMIRLVILVAGISALAGPYLESGQGGRDAVILVDRSLSVPDRALETATELVELAEGERGEHDRLYVLSFGGDAALEYISAGGGHDLLSSNEESGRFQGFNRQVDQQASDLGGALEVAVNLIEQGRRGTVLVLSDGENNGSDPEEAALLARSRGIRVDVRESSRPRTGDVAIDRIDVPGEVSTGEPFTIAVWVRSDRLDQRKLVIRRGDRLLGSSDVTLEPGLRRFVFRDLIDEGGIEEIEVTLVSSPEGPDRIPQNDRAMAAVRATGPSRVLVLNHDGGEDTLVRILRKAGIPTDVSRPEEARLDLAGLAGYRAVILENVAAGRLGREIASLKAHVTDHGAGLLMTGGRASFGSGGYYLSSLDGVLPVSMEVRQENRKLRSALSIVMDRSGSMGMATVGGETKMQLANSAASEALRLLHARDSVSVIAVDSSPSVVIPQTPVEDPEKLSQRVVGIQPGGGGIFVEVGLQAAYKQLDRSEILNQHVILFSDASDSEEPGKSVETTRRLFEQRGLTLSVIALGTDTDADADLLRDLALAGNGEVTFTQDAGDLARIFAMDTIRFARKTFIDEVTGVQMQPQILGVGLPPDHPLEEVAGYNLVYLRGGSTAGAVTTDENRTPIFAHRYERLGRTASLAAELGGESGDRLLEWPSLPEFLVTVTRWLAGTEYPEGVFTSVKREGRNALISVEIDPDSTDRAATSDLTAIMTGSNGLRDEVVLERAGENLYEARYRLDQEGIFVGTVQLESGPNEAPRSISLPPLSLPYSPEYEPQVDPDAGRRLLKRIARGGGGTTGAGAAGLFVGPESGKTWRMLTRDLAILVLLLLLVEIAGRRLELWQTSTSKRPRIARRDRGEPMRRQKPSPSVPTGAHRPPVKEAPRPTVESSPEGEAEPRSNMADALSRARRAADRRLDR